MSLCITPCIYVTKFVEKGFPQTSNFLTYMPESFTTSYSMLML